MIYVVLKTSYSMSCGRYAEILGVYSSESNAEDQVFKLIGEEKFLNPAEDGWETNDGYFLEIENYELDNEAVE